MTNSEKENDMTKNSTPTLDTAEVEEEHVVDCYIGGDNPCIDCYIAIHA